MGTVRAPLFAARACAAPARARAARRIRSCLAFAFALALADHAAAAGADYKIVTASEKSTAVRMGRDLARLVAPSADMSLETVVTAGSVDNVRRLRFEPNVKFALVQSDVWQAFVEEADASGGGVANLVRPLRVLVPLHREELYFLVRADSPIGAVHEIRDARIAAGPLGSGGAFTTTALYRQMFGESPSPRQVKYMSDEEALLKLVDDKSVDVVVLVSGQPAALLADMKPAARRLLKLLPLDPSHPASQAALRAYLPATVRAANLPNLLTQDLPALAVQTLLLTYDYDLPTTIGFLTDFARALCASLDRLRTLGHPKWEEVTLELGPAPPAGAYYEPTSIVLRDCRPVPGPGTAPSSRP